ncbi:bifunctional 2',3'-cyclic-nucleotide 2'-phosphodiesterase/3'-nucleotidase [Bacillus massiliigorillae]|uniref:bifunctional 2',3'-cyclic-nucleotide 2'-phosphodiesterase/3'-nucleotidase n=1 Tax=Bacillus massiliigorillae TaxID=1243664 RepID=UPI0003A4F1B4|nr:bifunctional 2',3'-cyclic-nucleotide 2'-phosphodiesterase/3'-nucleotidase [Bacillus massiliigorillae]
MKKIFFSKSILFIFCFAIIGSILAGCNKNNNATDNVNNQDAIDLTILSTTDVHNYLMNYDYYTTTETDNTGLVKVSTVIKKYKEDSSKNSKNNEVNNVIVVDNGDLIQGNPLGDFYARVEPVKSGEEHPVYKALRLAGFDAATLGNHEFNYGLDYLKQIMKDSKVPIVNANIYNAQTNKPEFEQYKIINKKVVAENGEQKEIKIGITGFVPPQILNWDKINLEGKVTVKDIKESAEEIVPKMKEAGADLIIALSHSGYGDGSYEKGEENESYELTKVKGIDAVIAGHSHIVFPAKDEQEVNTDLKNLDVQKGTMNGVATVQAGKYGEGVGVINLKVTPSDKGYKVVDSNSEYVTLENVKNDPEFEKELKANHEKVVAFVNSPVGNTTKDINTYFALVSDNNAVQLISNAQLEYAKKKVSEEASLSKYKDLPILSAAAPFKAGLSKDGTKADDYVEVKAGKISIKDVASIYKYPNTAVIMKVSGKDIKNWLEMSAGLFNTIDPNGKDGQELLNNNYPAFNFDTIDGVTYEIDVSKEPKYDVDGKENKGDSSRIVNLKYNGKDLKPEDEFLVVTNNYRASGGGNFPIFENDDAVAYISSDETRQIVTDYIKGKKTLDPAVDHNWKLKPIGSTAKVVFTSNSNGKALLPEYPFLSAGESKGDQLTEYIYDLNK